MPAPKHMQIENALRIINGRGRTEIDGYVVDHTVDDVCDAAGLIINEQQRQIDLLDKDHRRMSIETGNLQEKLRMADKYLRVIDERRWKWRERYETLLAEYNRRTARNK